MYLGRLKIGCMCAYVNVFLRMCLRFGMAEYVFKCMYCTLENIFITCAAQREREDGHQAQLFRESERGVQLPQLI